MRGVPTSSSILGKPSWTALGAGSRRELLVPSIGEAALTLFLWPSARLHPSAMGRDLVDLFLLAACWACTLSASTLLTEVGPLAAQEFGASDAISPFAVGSFLMGAALSSVPSAALFDCAGRRGGFLLGCMLTVVASALGVTATLRRDAALVFCATFFAGLAQGIGQFYRFAAMEVCAPSRKPFAVTLVLTGGVVAAFVGPELAQRTATVFGEERKYLCSFLAVGVIGLINATVCVLVAFAPPARIAQPLLDSASGLPQPVARTPLLKLMLQPKCGPRGDDLTRTLTLKLMLQLKCGAWRDVA
jgi:MFS family permease